MGRTSAQVSGLRQIIRNFDCHGIVTAQNNVVTHLLNVDWSGVLARDILTASELTQSSVRSFIGQTTVSSPTLIDAYEPFLLNIVKILLQEREHLASSAYLRDPLYCCAGSGWARVCQYMLELGAHPEPSCIDGVFPWERALLCGWMHVAEQLHQSLDSRFKSRLHSAPRFPLFASKAAHDIQVDETATPLAISTGPVSNQSSVSKCSEWAQLSLPRYPCQYGCATIPEFAEGASLEMERFLREHWIPKTPVIIRGGAAAAPALKWSAKDLLAAVPQASCDRHLSSIPYPDVYMPPDVAHAARLDGNLDAVLSGCSGYLFTEVDQWPTLGRLLRRDLDLPGVLPMVMPRKDCVLIEQFSAGQSGTGAPWHWHEDSFNICLAGERIWYFRPPSQALMSRQPVREGIPLASESYFAVQHPGDIVYVPQSWSHSVVNTVLSVAVAVEMGIPLRKTPLTSRMVAMQHKTGRYHQDRKIKLARHGHP